MENLELASWLVAHRAEIEQNMESRLGPAAPRAGADESEVLRRFRTYASLALHRGTIAEPALDGLRVNERRVTALLGAWSDAASEVAGPAGNGLREALAPLMVRFQASLRTTSAGRHKSGKPRARRRAVIAAMDRVADAFLAVDADDGRVVDANPAAGALLGVERDALLGVEATSFVPSHVHSAWWTEIDAMTEASEPRRFRGQLQDVHGTSIAVECSVTRFAPRGRTLALILARPSA